MDEQRINAVDLKPVVIRTLIAKAAAGRLNIAAITAAGTYIGTIDETKQMEFDEICDTVLSKLPVQEGEDRSDTVVILKNVSLMSNNTSQITQKLPWVFLFIDQIIGIYFMKAET